MALKVQLRRQVMAERRSRADRPGSQAALESRLEALLSTLVFRRLAAYLAMPGEADVDAVLRRHRQSGGALWLPRFNASSRLYDLAAVCSFEAEVRPGAFGIREPLPTLPAVSPAERCSADVLWLVPGVAFDAAGNRLGHGRGYYDRLLEGSRGVRIGVAWDWQVLPALPHDAHDVPMDWVVTDIRTIACRAATAAPGETTEQRSL